MTLAGIPAATEHGSIDFVTTEFAAITTLLPMVIGPKILDPAPM